MNKVFLIVPMLVVSTIFGISWRSDNQVSINSGLIHQFREQYQTDQITYQPIVQEMIDQVDQDRFLADLRRFTGEEPICTSHHECSTIAGRETGTQDLHLAEDYVYETLTSLHYSVERLNWSSGSYSDQNIVAYKQGLFYLDDEIYFIAHLDGYLANNPAADDDASGAVALLELARILAHRTLSHSVVLFFSTGEEHGTLGSHRFVAQYPERLQKIKYLVSVEMLGYDSNDDHVMELWSGDQNLLFQQMLSDIITTYPINLVPEIIPGCT